MARRKRLSPLPLTEGPMDRPLDGPVEGPVPGGVAETAPAGRSRAPIAAVSGGAAAEAALGEVAQALECARTEGRLAQPIPLEAVAAHHLARDRVPPAATAGVDEDMDALVESLRVRGQQMPIEVIDLGAGATGPRYGLIAGWRRLTALKRLAADGQGAGSQAPGTVLAVLRAPESAAEAYVAMVEENEIRQGLSYFERAQVVAQAVARGAYPDTRTALRALFSTASRAKRSKIGTFLTVVQEFGADLRFPAALPERLGLRLAQAIEADPGVAERISANLVAGAPQSPAEEQAILKAALAPPRKAPEPLARRVSDGVIYLSDEGSHLSLSGPGVTVGFRDELIAWLDARDAEIDRALGITQDDD